MNVEHPFEAVDLLYRAAVEPHLWPEALEQFARAVGCIGMAMIPITPNSTAGLIVSPSMQEVEQDYKDTWWRHDTRVGRIFERRLARGVFAEAELFGEEELNRDPFRQEFCRKFGIGAFAAQLIEPLPGQVVAFSGQRALGRGHFERDELERLAWLGRHAARALTVSLKLSSANAVVDGLLSTLDRFEGGVFVLNSRRRVTRMNGRAERMLGDGLRVERQQLLAGTSDGQRALDRLVSSALQREGRATAPIALQRPSGNKPFLAQAIPLSSGRALDDLADPTFGASGALVLVVDPGAGPALVHACLKLLGLTSAEARLAAMVGSGVRRREAAHALGISEWTARDTLKTIYSKLDITSVAELVRLVDSVAAIERLAVPLD